MTRYTLLLLCLMPFFCNAMSWQNLWLRPDQQGIHLFTQKKNKAAANHFHNPRWKAAAFYRAGQFKKAAELYSKLHQATDYYNQGNAWAKDGQYQNAIHAYQQALKQAPGMKDAQYNVALVKKLLQQQRKKEQQSQNKSSSQSKNKKSSSSASTKKQSSQSSNSQQKSSTSSPKNKRQQSQHAPSQKPGSAKQPNGASTQGNPSPKKQQSKKSALKNAKPVNTKASEQKKANAKRKGQPTTSSADAKRQNPSQTGTKQPLSRTDAQHRLQQAKMKQWLAQIPDDPGGLLRRKFLRNYERRQEQT